MDIRDGELHRDDVRALLRAHLASMHGLSPADSVHALDDAALRAPDVSFWTLREGDELLGCAALKSLGAGLGEVKSMRTATPHLRRGVAARLLTHVVDTARRRGYTRLSLETGTAEAFAPAHRLYERAGFVDCAPFAAYRDDPHSRFMTLMLAASTSTSGCSPACASASASAPVTD
jgi:putative acetyltransferase